VRRTRRKRQDGDLAEVSFRLKLAVPIWLLMVLAAMMLQRTGQIGRGTRLFLTWIGGPLLALALAALISWLLGAIARGFLGTVLSQGGEPPVPGYSEQEALVAAGRLEEAADSYRSRLVAFPQEIEARLRLARLLLSGGARDEPARLLQDARALATTAAQRLRISTALADLHRASGDHVGLANELSRCAREHPDTAAGEHARRELRAGVAARRDDAPPLPGE
jgi:hypothetical protein